MKLVRLKENSEGTETASKIRSILVPMEFTRLDEMVDVMFTTAADIEAASDEIATDEEAEEPQIELSKKAELKREWQFTDSNLLQGHRSKIISAVENKIGAKLINKSRALYWDAAHHVRVACTISKHYTRHKSYSYWYAYHPQWDEFLKEGSNSFFVLGGMDIAGAFVIPWKIIHEELPNLNTTVIAAPTGTFIWLNQSQVHTHYCCQRNLGKCLSMTIEYRSPKIPSPICAGLASTFPSWEEGDSAPCCKEQNKMAGQKPGHDEFD
jgi:hypothetical protein